MGRQTSARRDRRVCAGGVAVAPAGRAVQLGRSGRRWTGYVTVGAAGARRTARIRCSDRRNSGPSQLGRLGSGRFDGPVRGYRPPPETGVTVWATGVDDHCPAHRRYAWERWAPGGWRCSGERAEQRAQQPRSRRRRAERGGGVSLSIETSAQAGGGEDIEPRGEVDVDPAHGVAGGVAAVLSAGRAARIELDRRLVAFSASVGISAMVAAFQLASVGGVELVVTRPSRFVHRQLWVTDLLGLFGAPDPYVAGVAGTTQEPPVRLPDPR